MPLVAWQGSLQGVTFGTGTNYLFDDRAAISGIGNPKPKRQVVDLDHGDGAYAGTTRKASRVILIPFVIIGTSPTDAMDNYETLDAAFLDGGTDVTLELYLPGRHFTCVGRPSGTVEDLSRLKASTVRCLGQFDAFQPALTLV